jgi:hypothetical protein
MSEDLTGQGSVRSKELKGLPVWLAESSSFAASTMAEHSPVVSYVEQEKPFITR